MVPWDNAGGLRDRAGDPSVTPPGGVLDGRERNASSSNGFTRKPNAPPWIAAARIAGVSRPVIMITFVSGDISRSRACTCSPLVSGIHVDQSQRDHVAASVGEENVFIFEALRLQPIGIEQLHNRIPHRGVVIENAYGIRLCWHRISTYSNPSAAPSLRYCARNAMVP
jgi:hypothetical protein